MLRLLTSKNCVYVRVCFEGERDLMAFKFSNYCLIFCRLVNFYFFFFGLKGVKLFILYRLSGLILFHMASN